MSKLEKHGHDTTQWYMVQDEAGRPLGHVKAPSALLREQVAVVRRFLEKVSKQKGEERMPEQKKEKTNIAYLAGILKMDPKVFDNNTKALLDVGMKSAIQISIYTGSEAPEGNEQLARKLKAFRKGDFIQTVCMLRPYGVKQDDDKWKNSISIDVTAIKTEPPRRSREQQADDDIPY